jgi:hypothetical protein
MYINMHYLQNVHNQNTYKAVYFSPSPHVTASELLIGFRLNLILMLNHWKPKLEGKRPLGRPRCMWEDNIGMDLREMGWGGIG